MVAMDPLTQGIIAGVIANALTGLLAGVFSSKDEQKLREELEEDSGLATILQEAAVSVADARALTGGISAEKLRTFLLSPEAEAIVRQIYASQLTKEETKYVKTIRAEFLASLSLHLGEEEGGLEKPAEQLFNALLMACERALETAIDEGVLSAHEGRSAARQRVVLDELAAVESNLAFLAGRGRPDVQAVVEFEEEYRRQVADRHGHIIPPHFDVARKVPIEQLYVAPDFVRAARKKGEEPATLEAAHFLSVVYRAVLLGHPGAGKSTFASKVCYDLASRYGERVLGGRRATPILVVLRDYGAEKKARNCSILQFIEATANSKYQVEAAAGAFEYLLLNGRAVVIFDGLDELLESSYRREISADVESFCNLYPAVPVLVTSREVGYEQAPLDERRFEIFRLAPFNDEQVRDYAGKWFAADPDLTAEQRKRKADDFLEESQAVTDLRSNPLMLALMCNIYRGENYIPRNRPDVYEKCALMLFERWDKSRGIFVLLPFEAHIRPTIMYLAQWIHGDEALQGGVTEERLVAKAADYLCSWRFEHRDEAEGAARDFIDFCTGRAWVFTDTGTTEEGERLYQFTHRTFLEYFTAAHLFRTNPTADGLAEVLLPRIARREWDVVAQLAFQLQSKHVEGAGEALLSKLIGKARGSGGDEGWNFLSFAARCLEFMVPQPKVTRDITVACVERCLAWGAERVEPEELSLGRDEPQRGARGLLGDVLVAADENRRTVADTIEKLVVERARSGGEGESLRALEMGLHLTVPLYVGGRGRVARREVREFWEGVSERIFGACSAQMEALCPKHVVACLWALYRRKVGVRELTEWHGVKSLFSGGPCLMLAPVWLAAPAGILIHALLGGKRIWTRAGEREFFVAEVGEVGDILLRSAPPWMSAEKHAPPLLSPWILEEESEDGEGGGEPLSLDSRGLFGAFALLAAALETAGEWQGKLRRAIRSSRLDVFHYVRWIVVARFERTKAKRVQEEMSRCGFTAEQQDFAWRWVRREIDLVDTGAAEK